LRPFASTQSSFDNDYINFVNYIHCINFCLVYIFFRREFHSSSSLFCLLYYLCFVLQIPSSGLPKSDEGVEFRERRFVNTCVDVSVV